MESAPVTKEVVEGKLVESKPAEITEEEVKVVKNKPAKAEPVSKGAPKADLKPKVEEKAVSEDDWGSSPKKDAPKVEKSDSDYSADWGENDLEDKSAPASKPEVKPISIPEKSTAPVIPPAATVSQVAVPKFEEPKPEKIDFFG